MAGNVETGARGRSHWRTTGWGLAALLLLLPFVAMQFTDEVDWSAGDFMVFGLMLAIAGGTVELAVRYSRNSTYRAGAGLTILGSFLLIWVNGAVGFLGSEDNPANLMFALILLINVLGAIAVGGRASGMTRVLLASAAVQVLIGVIAFFAGLASEGPQGLYEVVMGTTLFAGIWLGAAGLFRIAARRAE